MAGLSKDQQKELAKYIFLKEKQITQQEIAERVGVTRVTVNKWIKSENWDSLKKTLLGTREERMRELYDELTELNGAIRKRPDGERFATSREADTRRKIVRDIKELETRANIREVIDVFKRLLDWLRPADYQKAKEIGSIFDAFIKDNLK